jgi:hypothetical protein
MYIRVRQNNRLRLAALDTSSVLAIWCYLLFLENHIDKKQCHKDGKQQQYKSQSRTAAELEIAKRNVVKVKGKDFGGIGRSALG